MVRHIILKSRPQGIPAAATFGFSESTLPELHDGQMRVAPKVFSMDPAIRGFLDDRPSYLPPVAIGAPINGMSLGEVVDSRNAAFPVGTMVRVFATWSDQYIIGPEALGLERVNPAPGVPLVHYMGALGPVGLTAWVGLTVIGALRPGDTVLVSAAAGATGSTVGQIAKIRGCNVIGLVGSTKKAMALAPLGFDHVINYRATPDIATELGRVASDGIDIYFDNVGGETLETVLPLMRPQGRVVVCGMIGQYNDADHPYGIKTLWQLVVNRLTMRGFLTYDHADRLGEAQDDLDRWYASGALTPLVNERRGFEQIPSAFIDLMSGTTIGKTLVTG